MFNRVKSWFKKPVSYSTVSIPVESGSFIEYVLGRDTGDILPSKAMEFYGKNSAIATAVDLIAENFEEMVPVLKDEKDKIILKNPVVDFLKKPNGFENYKEFIGQLARHYLLTHNSHVIAVGNVKREPIEIYAIKPQNLVIMEDMRDSYPGKYIINSGVGSGDYLRVPKKDGVIRFYSSGLKEIFHLMGFSSKNTNLWADSPLSAVALEVRTQIHGKYHNLKLIKNGGRLSLIVSFKDDGFIEPQEHEDRKKRLNEDLGGPANAGKIAVISAPEVSIREVGVSPKDMDFSKLEEMASKAIYLRYKTPLPLVSNIASTYNNIETSIPLLYDQAIIPLANTLFAGLSRFLLPRFKIDTNKFRISYDQNSITALRLRTLEEMKKRAEIGVETKNEIRSLYPDRSPVQGGDVLYQPATEIPLGTDLGTGKEGAL